MSENDIQRQIVQTLRKVGIYCIRINSGKVKVMGGWMSLAPEGTADILALPRMKLPIWFEVKAGKGKQGEAQKDFEHLVRSLGHGYFVLRSIDDLEPLLEEMR